jgi:hypothetical protein
MAAEPSGEPWTDMTSQESFRMDIVPESHRALDVDVEVLAEHVAGRELARANAREQRLRGERRKMLVALRELETDNAQLLLLRDQLAATRDELSAVQERWRRLARVHQDLLDSLSWRLTRPLRWGSAMLRLLRRSLR